MSGTSQLSVTLVPGDLISSSGLSGYHSHVQKSPLHIYLHNKTFKIPKCELNKPINMANWMGKACEAPAMQEELYVALYT